MPLTLFYCSAIVMFGTCGYMLLGAIGVFEPFRQYLVVGLPLMCVSLFGMVFFSAVDDAVKEADLNQQIIDILDGK